MSKGQSLVIQFIAFFLIGFSLFVSTSNIFQYQSKAFQDMIIDSSLNLSNSYLSSAIIATINSCKNCDSVNITVKLQNTTADYVLGIGISQASGLSVSIPPIGKYSSSNVHNIISFLTQCSGNSTSNKPISLTFNKNQNKLEVK